MFLADATPEALLAYRHEKLAPGIGSCSNDWSHLVGKISRKQRQIVGVVMHGAKSIADSRLAFFHLGHRRP
jgi:hypothetical protein